MPTEYQGSHLGVPIWKVDSLDDPVPMFPPLDQPMLKTMHSCPNKMLTCITPAGCDIGHCLRSEFEKQGVYVEPPPLPTKTVDPIQSTLIERGARYGDFTTHAAIAEDLINTITNTNGWKNRTNPVQRQALRVIADKIARILNGDPNYDDNWRDIIGYATLVLERLPK